MTLRSPDADALHQNEGAELLVADSFRVDIRDEIPSVRAWRRHLERFRDSLRRSNEWRAAPSPEQSLGDFLSDAARCIREYGPGFPRLEAWRGSTLRFNLQLRPLPPLGDTLDMRSSPETVLATPGVKGPNIARLAQRNAELGAEALLVDTEGQVLEGATTSLVWWDQSGGCIVAPTPSGEPNRVPSVTEAALVSIGTTLGAPLAPARATPRELARYEVWAVNALHGIRIVRSIDGVTLPAPDAARLRAFRHALDETWEPVVP